MTPETPDPPPVSPDPWTLAQEYFDRHVTETQQTLTQVESRLDTSIEFKEDRALVAHLRKNLEYFAVRADGIRQLVAARAADALRHQQEIADLTRAVQGNALAVVKASAEGGSQIADLRAALSTAEATIQQHARDMNAVIASLTARVEQQERQQHDANCELCRMEHKGKR